MEEYKPKKARPEIGGPGGPAGPRVPVKGDSSPSDVPREDEGATFVVGPSTPPIDSNAAAGDVTFVDPSPTPAAGKPRLSDIFPKQNQLQTGDVLGGRFEILDVLGEGGMGTVYKALDREVDHIVALKLIRPEMAAHPAILARFKQELLTARQVTHRNVIRIYDLSEVDGVKFITMEYVEGCDLRKLLLDKGKLPPEQAVEIIRQVCLALEAAHSAGVIHRDLKPQNIMLDKQERILVMDFGLARSLESGGMTQTGALMGTIEYMSPEQAMGKQLDARSDLFAVGLIFYELLTCKIPFKAETAVASLLKRNQERALPAAELDASIPKALSDIVGKCLERDLNLRYQSAQEILADLDAWQGKRPISASVVMPAPAPPRAVPWKWIAIAATLLLLVATPIVMQRVMHKTSAQHAPVSVLVADFTNHTGDPVFDGTLEPMFNVALEGASFISAYNRGSARKLAQKLPNPTDKLDEQPARLVALSQGISTVIGGEISRRGNDYNVSAIALDAVTGNVIARAEATAPNKEGVLGTIPKLVIPIRNAMGDNTLQSAQKSAAETFTAGSLEAAHAYAVGQDFQQAGKWAEAMNSYSQAVALDPNLGRAYAGTAAMYANLGKRQDAEKYYQLALARIDRMTDREKYRTRSGYYLLMRNQPKAIEELSALVSQYPADTAGHANLALAYFYGRNMAKARDEQKRALEITPHSILQRVNFAMYALYEGDFDASAKEAKAILDENPKSEKALRTLALAELGRGHTAEARQNYMKLQEVSAYGASVAATGLADVALYEGKLSDAASILQKAIASDLAAKNAEYAADRSATLALTQLTLGKTQEAAASAGKALAGNPDPGVIYRAAQAYLGAGQESKALQLIAPLSQRLETEPQIYAKLIAGEAQLRRGNVRESLNTLREAQKLADTWLGHFDMGLAYLAASAFTEASSEFDICLKRRGEATSIFLDDVPSYHLLPAVYYYQGRALEGLNSPGAAESYKKYITIKEKGAGDPMIADARRRLGVK